MRIDERAYRCVISGFVFRPRFVSGAGNIPEPLARLVLIKIPDNVRLLGTNFLIQFLGQPEYFLAIVFLWDKIAYEMK